MGQPHVHREIIIAWANGEPIQWYRVLDNKWIDCNQDYAPTFDRQVQYRIKPDLYEDLRSTLIQIMRQETQR